MKVIRNAVITAACMLALGAGALAQQKSSKGTEAKVPIAGKATLGVTVEETEMLAPGWRASKLMKADVRNDMNEKIGKVDDLIISPDGNISVVVVDVGGFIGVASHKVAIPVRQFKRVSTEKVILPGATKDELKKLPHFEYMKK